MPIDTSIYSNLIAKPTSLAENIGALDQVDLQRTQLASSKANLIGQQQALADDQAVRKLYADPTFSANTPQGLQQLYAVSPKAGAAAQKTMLDNQKTQADIGHLNAQTDQAKAAGALSVYDLGRKKIEAATGIVTSAATPADAHAKFQQAVQQGLMTPEEAAQKEQEVPQDPGGFQNWKQASALSLLTASQKIDAAQKAAQLAETTRHNTVDETNTVRGQNISAQTSRSNNAANIAKDYKIAGYDANGNMVDLGLGAPGASMGAPAKPPQSTLQPGMSGPPAPAGAPAYTVAPQGAAVPPKSPLQGLVDSIGTYQSPENTALSRVPPVQKSQILAAVKSQYPDYSPMNYTEQQAGTRAFAPNGKSGQAVKSFNVGLAHLDTLSDLATKLDNGQVPVLNSLGNYVAQQSGGTAQTNFAAAKNIVTDEVVKAIVGGGGGVGDRDKAAATINAAQTPQQLQQAIGTVKTLMGGQLVGLEQSYKASTGKSDFRSKYLSPEAQSAIKALDQSAPSGSATPGAPTGFKITHIDGKAQ